MSCLLEKGYKITAEEAAKSLQKIKNVVEIIQELRNTLAGAFALRLYRDNRYKN